MRTHSSIILEINIDQMKILIEKNRIQVNILFLNKKNPAFYITFLSFSKKKLKKYNNRVQGYCVHKRKRETLVTETP